MANELDKTIEELEAEVLDELEEANGADAPKKGAVPTEKMDKLDKNKEDSEAQDTGNPVVKPDQADAPAKKVAAKAKEVSGDKAQKGEGKPDSIDKPNDGEKKVAKPLAAGYKVDHDGDKISEAKMTKDAMKAEMSKKLDGMKVTELKAAYDAMMSTEDDEEMDEQAIAKAEAVEKRMKEIDVSEHVEALMNGEGDLSEEFKRKAATVFEAAVKSKVRDEVARLEDEYKSELDENMKTTKSELVEKVDTYLNYVVEEWMKENELAIERGLKGEIAEDFISGLKQLFEDHYVDIPDEKYDVLGAQSDKISELESKLNETIERVVTLNNANAILVREQVISEISKDLAETEIEKFKSLTDDVEFKDEESFKEKLDTLKESYFPKNKPVETQTVNDVDTGTAQDIDTTDSMQAYLTAIGRASNNSAK